MTWPVITLQMENNGKGTEPTTSASCINLENVLQELDVLSKCMDQLAGMHHCYPVYFQECLQDDPAN